MLSFDLICLDGDDEQEKTDGDDNDNDHHSLMFPSSLSSLSLWWSWLLRLSVAVVGSCWLLVVVGFRFLALGFLVVGCWLLVVVGFWFLALGLLVVGSWVAGC